MAGAQKRTSVALGINGANLCLLTTRGPTHMSLVASPTPTVEF